MFRRSLGALAQEKAIHDRLLRLLHSAAPMIAHYLKCLKYTGYLSHSNPAYCLAVCSPPSLGAHILTEKFCYHQPFCRQEWRLRAPPIPAGRRGV